MYSTGKLSEISGVSSRTLRYYDEIGLLKPNFINESGYRYYGDKEVALLQQILFYKERGFDLNTIKEIIYSKDFDLSDALEEHLSSLEEQKLKIDRMINSVKLSIKSLKGEYNMTDRETFEVFKKNLIDKNERTYGKEIREKYGDDSIDESNRKMLNMSEEDYQMFKELEENILTLVEKCVKENLDLDSKEAKELVNMHQKWIKMTWNKYSVEAHKSLAMMYTMDERFKEYYDRNIEGCADYLSMAIENNL
ncbi:MerR family transcriptional regulator [Peptacetobacter sp. AB845]|uniref:MerR family transcriptional regulator n=1 Tax=Peptacetobacter sp. AB845 TaxID=3388429 RepID=UPI0039C8DAC6